MDEFFHTIIALTAIFAVFGFPILGILVWRILAHRERMAMIRSGAVPPGGSWQGTGYGAGYGQPGPAPGTPPGAMPGYDPFGDPRAMRGWMRAQRRAWRRGCGPYDPASELRGGIRVAFIGLALLIGLSFIGYSDGSISPGPWLLGGLIPLFVGLARIASALAGGATFANFGGFVAGGQPFTPPPGPG
ncbi:MAG: hypothetical protein ACREM2_11100, partial [Vulcanimicrobiaceae bacterium]